MTAQIGQPAPLLSVSGWVQGGPVNFDQLTGRIVLVEVFQVNCPGCFLYALPQAIYLHECYADQGLSVLGIATAFEDFDKNNLNNLVRLAEKGQVVGETLLALSQRGELIDGRLPYRIPFPLAMDLLNKREDDMTDDILAEGDLLHPGDKALAQFSRLKTRNDPRYAVMRWNAVLQIEPLAQPILFIFAKLYLCQTVQSLPSRPLR